MVAFDSALVRVELGIGESWEGPPAAVRLSRITGESVAGPVLFLGPATTTEPLTQGQAFHVLVMTNRAGLRPGAGLSAWLTPGGEPRSGWLVPRTAVVRYGGKAWIYVAADNRTFVRREIALNHPVEAGWGITTGLTDQDRVVTVGAQALLSQELKSEIPDAD